MRAAVIACALASAGCELVFPFQGGDDGDDGDDAPPPPDAAMSFCTEVNDPAVVLCADFDTVATGLVPGRLDPITSTGGDVTIEPDPFGPSPPRALRTAQAALPGPGSSWAQAIHNGPARWNGSVDVFVRALQPETADCVPVVLGVGLLSASVKIQAFGGGYRVLVQSNDTVVDSSASLPVDLLEWNQLNLAVDLPTGLVELTVNQAAVATLSAQAGLIAEAATQATIVTGVAMVQPHGECSALFDNLVVRTFLD